METYDDIAHLAPWFFPAVWRIISPMFNKKFASKWAYTTRDRMHEHIALNQLHSSVGGTSSFSHEAFIRERCRIEGVPVDESIFQFDADGNNGADDEDKAGAMFGDEVAAA